MFAGAKDLGARVLLPVYHRLPAADEFDSLEFLRVEVATDDGLAQAVCEEAFVAKTCPTPSDSNSSEQRCTALPLLITTPLLLLPLQVPDADLLLLLAVLGAQAVEVRGLRRGGADAKAEEARRGGRERRGSGAVGAGRIKVVKPRLFTFTPALSVASSNSFSSLPIGCSLGIDAALFLTFCAATFVDA